MKNAKISRRSFLLGLAACSAAGILTACKGDDTPASSASTSPEAPASSVSELEPIGLFTVEDFPKLDGSTACIPLMAQMMADTTGIDLEVAQSGISVSTTAYAWENFGLYPDEEYTARMLVVYEAPDYVKEELKSKRPAGTETHWPGRTGVHREREQSGQEPDPAAAEGYLCR